MENAAALDDPERAAILRAAVAVGIVGGGPGAAPRLLARLCDPAVDGGEIVAITGRDPGLAARVLRVANSAYYGRSRTVKTVDHAVSILGLDAVRGIAAAACLDRSLLRSGATAQLDVDALVGHSLATAVLAEQLARGEFRRHAGDAFIAGLLHNLGTLVQAQLHQRPMQMALQGHATRDVDDIRALEEQAGLTPHEYCVRVVFEDWALPSLLSEATAGHHAPLSVAQEARPLAALLHVAAAFAADAGYGWALEPPVAAFDADCRALLGITDEDLAATLAQLPDRVALLAGLRG
jgi:HD-like signal output (HDOD) protein